MTVVVGFDRAQPLRLTAERLVAVQIGIVVDLHEWFERNAEALAVAEHSAVVIRQPPRTGIDVQTRIEAAFLGLTAQLRIAIASPQRPVAAAGAGVVLQYLDPVSGIAQFVGGHESGHARPQHQHRGALRSRAQLDRTTEG